MAARIIGIGQQWAGDDGVGLAVIRKLREFDGQVDLVEVDEPTRLIDLLTDGADPVVLVDAVLDDGPAGRVLLIDPQTPGGQCRPLLSTHGVGVMEAIELARVAYPDRTAQRISIVGITIQETFRRGNGVSRAVERAVPRAAEQALALAASQ
ncbi:MAG TPA: hydrogenase maturation protease [Candidatus Binataceae bacterium]